MIKVRKAVWDDRDELFKLASSLDVRNASFYPGEILYENHLIWFDKILKNKNEVIYILTESDIFLGQIRFSLDGNSCIVGISLDEKARGKKYGVLFFNNAFVKLRKEYKNIKQIKAFIKEENIRSQKYFKKIGFLFSKDIYKNSFKAQEWVYNIEEVFIIAELSANHNQNIDIAKQSIEEIKKAGADAVKIQTYTADTITIDCDNEYFQIKQGTLWDGRTLYNLYKEAYTPWEWHEELKEYAESLGLLFFSSPFDFTAVDFLETLNVPFYKIASFEITDIPLIEYTASKGKPMIISTGIAKIEEIQEAVDACRRMNNFDITLLQCTSSYPAPVEDANLRMIPNLSETFGVKAGLSDHTEGTAVAVASVALGATMIEKHFILDRTIGGPDAAFSMEPTEFSKMVEDIRTVEKALGKVNYNLTEQKIKSRKFSRSLFVVKNIAKGESISEKNIRSIRPGDGLSPILFNKILGLKASRNLKKGEPLKWDMIKNNVIHK